MSTLPIGTMVTFQQSAEDDILYGEITDVMRSGYIVRTRSGSHFIKPGMILRVSGGA